MALRCAGLQREPSLPLTARLWEEEEERPGEVLEWQQGSFSGRRPRVLMRLSATDKRITGDILSRRPHWRGWGTLAVLV